MPIVFADRVQETTVTAGVGTVALGGAVAGFQTFLAGIGLGNQSYYAITETATGAWEVGIGTLGVGTFSRDSVLSSSNANALVVFLAGAKEIFSVSPASFYAAAITSTGHSTLNHAGIAGIGNLATAPGVGVVDHATVAHAGVTGVGNLATAPGTGLVVHSTLNHAGVTGVGNLATAPGTGLVDHTTLNHAGIPGAGGLPTDYMVGLGVRCAEVAGTATCVVEPGRCRDYADTADMTLTAEKTASFVTNGINGRDLYVIPGLTATTGGFNFFPAFSIIPGLDKYPTPLTGTVSAAVLTLTGIGTRFLSELRVGDLIGTDITYGFSLVTAIASDTSATVAGFNGFISFSGQTLYRIEDARITVTTSFSPNRYTIQNITANGLNLVVLPSISGSGTATNFTVGWTPTALNINEWFSLWLVSGTSGVGTLFGYRRSKPVLLGVPGYDTSWRRVGWVKTQTSTTLYSLRVYPGGPTRRSSWEVAAGSAGITVLSAASVGVAATLVSCTGPTPPTCRSAFLICKDGSSTGGFYVYGNNFGPFSPRLVARSAAAVDSHMSFWVLLDHNQVFKAATSAGTALATIIVSEFEDVG